MQVQSLGRDHLQEDMATHSSVLAWRIPWTEEPGGPQSRGSQESDTTEQLNQPTNHVLSQLGRQSLFSRKQAIPLHLFHVFYKEHDLLENNCRGTADEMTCVWVRV